MASEPIGYDMPDPASVHDRASFERFFEALVRDREHAESRERASPLAHSYASARGWQNTTISQYLECALAGASAQSGWSSEQGLTWQELAIFLYLGKVYE
ncbi:MAG: hypothetical protein ACTHOH_08555 [Lysobacteraceae bacterium]